MECRKNGFDFEGRLWPPQFEVGYRSVVSREGDCEETVNGFRAGLATTMVRRLRGLVVGGYNESSSVDGVVVGLVNRGEETRGLSVGLWNQNSRAHRGVAIGLANVGGALYGFDLGVVNYAKGDMTGFQPAIVGNEAKDNMTGFQPAILWNEAKDNMTGFQPAILVNVANDMDGVVIGLINDSQECRWVNPLLGGFYCLFGKKK